MCETRTMQFEPKGKCIPQHTHARARHSQTYSTKKQLFCAPIPRRSRGISYFHFPEPKLCNVLHNVLQLTFLVFRFSRRPFSISRFCDDFFHSRLAWLSSRRALRRERASAGRRGESIAMELNNESKLSGIFGGHKCFAGKLSTALRAHTRRMPSRTRCPNGIYQSIAVRNNHETTES